jgi:hypothetical protein
MNQILDRHGRPINNHARPKSSKIAQPKVGGFGQQQVGGSFFANLPGGGMLQFDLNKLTLADFRSMRQHYQLGASLNVLAFVMHQIDWHIECEDQEIADFIEGDLREHWTNLIFSLSQSFWAGYAPTAVNYENRDGHIRLKRFKDLVPEECWPRWKVEEGWAPPGDPKPKIHAYDGFYQNGVWIPPENTLWYPLLMEGGDHWGRKLLKPAFPAWFFSNLLHMYANRYFERFGEPLPVGRAPFEEEVLVAGGEYITGREAMENIVHNIRNRSVAVLPSDRDPDTKQFEYDIEYLESQMRGADFERYMGRLDEEMSLSVFTPILLFRTADVGSYNLGQAHLKIFEQMLNAIAGDAQFYIQRYLVDRMRVLNFGQKSPRATWTFRRLGTLDLAIYKEVLVELIRQGAAKVDMDELGGLMGLKLEEVEVLTATPEEPDDDPDAIDPDAPKPEVKAGRAMLAEAAKRAARQMGKGDPIVTLGFKNKFVEGLRRDGFKPNQAAAYADTIYAAVNGWIDDVGGVFADPDEVKSALDRVIEIQLAA